MFNKGIKDLFVRDDTQSMKLPKDMKKRGVKYEGCVYYEYTYQEVVDGIVPCICGEIAPKDIYSRSTYSETHTKNDHVDGRCLKCADRENWKECFNYLKSTHAEIVHTHSDVLKHTNIMKMLGNEFGEIKCICGKVYPISYFHVSIPYDSAKCCEATLKGYNKESSNYLDNKKKQEWEYKHGKFKHED